MASNRMTGKMMLAEIRKIYSENRAKDIIETELASKGIRYSQHMVDDIAERIDSIFSRAKAINWATDIVRAVRPIIKKSYDCRVSDIPPKQWAECAILIWARNYCHTTYHCYV